MAGAGRSIEVVGVGFVIIISGLIGSEVLAVVAFGLGAVVLLRGLHYLYKYLSKK
jgi:hypothetical protein